MTHPWGEDLWNLLTMFNGMGYMALFVLAVIWARLLLSVFEEALTSRKRPSHKFVHPLPSPSNDTRHGFHHSPDAEDFLPPRLSVGRKGRGRKDVCTRKGTALSVGCDTRLTTATARRILDSSPL
jgi:hypothetical protein